LPVYPGAQEMHTTAHTENWFSYSNPFTISGDRIYVRGCYMLYCIGEK
jgi:hypothetical protein